MYRRVIRLNSLRPYHSLSHAHTSSLPHVAWRREGCLTLLLLYYPSLRATSVVGLKSMLRFAQFRNVRRPSILYLDSAHEAFETLLELHYAYMLVGPNGVVFGDDWIWPAVKNDVIAFGYLMNIPVYVYHGQVRAGLCSRRGRGDMHGGEGADDEIRHHGRSHGWEFKCCLSLSYLCCLSPSCFSIDFSSPSEWPPAPCSCCHKRMFYLPLHSVGDHQEGRGPWCPMNQVSCMNMFCTRPPAPLVLHPVGHLQEGRGPWRCSREYDHLDV